jgi:hypothetical protein
VIVEVGAGKDPFQVIWEYMDAGRLQIEMPCHQGFLTFEADSQGMMRLGQAPQVSDQ